MWYNFIGATLTSGTNSSILLVLLYQFNYSISLVLVNISLVLPWSVVPIHIFYFICSAFFYCSNSSFLFHLFYPDISYQMHLFNFICSILTCGKIPLVLPWPQVYFFYSISSILIYVPIHLFYFISFTDHRNQFIFSISLILTRPWVPIHLFCFLRSTLTTGTNSSFLLYWFYPDHRYQFHLSCPDFWYQFIFFYIISSIWPQVPIHFLF